MKNWLAGIIAAITFVVYAAHSIMRWWRFETAGYDLGIFDSVVRAYAHFQTPIVWLKGENYNIWGDHFHPILMLLAPLYWIWDDPRMLLLAQAGLIASSVIVVYRFASRKISPKLAPWLAIGYAFSWAIQTLINFDFHEIAFAVPLLALAIDAMDRRSDLVLLLSCLGLLLVREDMGLVVLLFGLIRIWRRPYWVGLGLIISGITVFILATQVILPYFSPTGEYSYWAYEALGPNISSAVLYMLKNPIATLVLFFTPPVKLLTFGLLFIPVALLSFRSPYVLACLPLLVQRFLASRDYLWIPYFHYNAPAWVIIFLAALDGFSRIPKLSHSSLSPTQESAPNPPLPLGAGRGEDKHPLHNWRYWFTGWVAAWSIVPILVFAPISPINDLVNLQKYQNARILEKQQLLAQIPASTCVGADDLLAGRLLRTNRATLPGISSPKLDFLALDLSKKAVGITPMPHPRAIYALAIEDGWKETFRKSDLVLLQHPKYSGPSALCAPYS